MPKACCFIQAEILSISSLEGWGFHFLASDSPIPNRNPHELAERLPANARSDFVEWGPFPTPEMQFTAILKNEIGVEDLIRQAPSVAPMTDDHPVNEYYLLRRFAK